jgi:hypothetical protein
MEGSRTPIRLWLLAISLHSRPGGINAIQLTAIIGTTYKTGWLICHKIRHAISQADQCDLLTGLVRINCEIYGRPHNPTIYRHPQEQLLQIGGTMTDSGSFTRIKIKQALEKHHPYINSYMYSKHSFIQQHVHASALEIIEATQLYGRERSFLLTEICRKSSYWINKTFRGIGAKHLQAYLDQYSFNYNCKANDLNQYSLLLSYCVAASTSTYTELIVKPNFQPALRAYYSQKLRMVS